MITGNILFGWEWAAFGQDSLDKYVHDYVTQMAKKNTGRIQILDIGGASGHRAQELAEIGADVHVIDLCERLSDVLKRNEEIGRNAITFQQADVTELNASDMKQKEWNLINMKGVSHFISFEDMKKLLTLIPRICHSGTHLSLSFQYSNKLFSRKTVVTEKRKVVTEKSAALNGGLQLHHHAAIKRMMKELGYKIIFTNRKYELCGKECIIFAKVPGKRLLSTHPLLAQTSRSPG